MSGQHLKLIFLFFIFSLKQALSNERAFHLDPQWNHLLFSDIPDSGRLLISKQRTPKAEWDSSLELFKAQISHVNDHPQCLYTARRLVMARLLGDKFPTWVHCPEYEEWMRRIDPVSASLIFAGHYPDNPGSLFGHTFIRLHSRGQDNPILDQAINFSAEITDEYGIFYALKGLLGFYYGGFSLTPYYMKVNEYSEGESRDIWEYPTTLGETESRFLLALIWELRQRADFRYYFLTKNCSYFILKAFETAKPEISLTNKLPWYVIPVETVKIAHGSQLLGKPLYRQSVQLMAKRKISELTPLKRPRVKSALDTSISLHENDPTVLKAASWQMSALNSRKDGKLSASLRQREHEILLKISESEDSSSNIKENSGQAPPEKGHAVRQVGLGVRAYKDLRGTFEFMPGVHEFLDHPTGYLENSELAILRTQLSFTKERLRLQSLEYLSMMILRPWYLNDYPASWEGSFFYSDERFVFNPGEKALTMEGGLGPSFKFRELTTAFLFGASANSYHQDRTYLYPMGHFFLSQTGLKFRHQLGIKVFHDMDEKFQLMPDARFVVSTSVDTEISFFVSPSIQGQNLYPTPAQMQLKIEVHY